MSGWHVTGERTSRPTFVPFTRTSHHPATATENTAFAGAASSANSFTKTGAGFSGAAVLPEIQRGESGKPAATAEIAAANIAIAITLFMSFPCRDLHLGGNFHGHARLYLQLQLRRLRIGQRQRKFGTAGHFRTFDCNIFKGQNASPLG